MLSQGSTMMQRMLIISLWKSKIVKSSGNCMGTRAVFFKRLCHSYYWLYVGLKPTHDADMVELPVEGDDPQLAGGWCGTLFALCQDLEALAEELGLKSHTQTDGCNWCHSNESSTPWIHLHKGAKWLTTVWKGRQWLARMRPTNALFNLVGVTITTAAPDWMHNKHIGTDHYVYAAVIKYLVHYLMPQTIEENNVVFFEQLNVAYKDRRIYMLSHGSPCTRHITYHTFVKFKTMSRQMVPSTGFSLGSPRFTIKVMFIQSYLALLL